MVNSTDRMASEKAEREEQAKAARRAEEASIVSALRLVLQPDEQLMGFARGRIAGGIKGRLNIGLEAFFAPFINIGLTERRVVIQHLNGETGRPGEMLPHYFAVADVRSVRFADIETYGAAPACRLILDLTNGQSFRIRLTGEGNFENAKALTEVYRSLTSVRKSAAGPTERVCVACSHILDRPSHFCPYCGTSQVESPAQTTAESEQSPADVEKVTVVVSETRGDLLEDALEFLRSEPETASTAPTTVDSPAASEPETETVTPPSESPIPDSDSAESDVTNSAEFTPAASAAATMEAESHSDSIEHAVPTGEGNVHTPAPIGWSAPFDTASSTQETTFEPVEPEHPASSPTVTVPDFSAFAGSFKETETPTAAHEPDTFEVPAVSAPGETVAPAALTAPAVTDIPPAPPATTFSTPFDLPTPPNFVSPASSDLIPSPLAPRADSEDEERRDTENLTPASAPPAESPVSFTYSDAATSEESSGAVSSENDEPSASPTEAPVQSVLIPSPLARRADSEDEGRRDTQHLTPNMTMRVHFHIKHPAVQFDQVIIGKDAEEVVSRLKDSVVAELKFPIKLAAMRLSPLELAQEIVNKYNQEERKSLPRPQTCTEFLQLVESIGYATIQAV